MFLSPGIGSVIELVPSDVPLLDHNRKEVVLLLFLAAKNSVPLRLVIPETYEEFGYPGYVYGPFGSTSATIIVPDDVPSLFHNSRPVSFEYAEKNSVPLRFVRLEGLEEFGMNEP